MKQLISLQQNKLLGIVLTILVLFSCMPFFLIGGGSTLINLSVFIVYLLLFFIYVAGNGMILRFNRTEVFCSVVLFVFLYFPFRRYDQLVASVIWPLIFLSILFLDKRILFKVIYYFSDIIFYISFGAVLVYILLLIGINLPSYDYSTGLEGTIKSTYTLYPFTAKLLGQDYSIFGRTMFRISGIFSEPGHFGIIISMVLYLNNVLLSNFKRVILIVAAVLTFSMGTYVLLCGLLLIKYGMSRKVFIVFIPILSLAFFTYLILPQEILERFILNKIGSNSSDVLNERTSADFTLFYDNYNRANFNLVGAGRLVFEKFQLSNSDYRGFFLKFGFLGLVLLVFWFAFINRNRSKIPFLLTAFLFLVVFLHRAWLVDYLIFYFIIYMIPISYKGLPEINKHN
ncbi:hypothetical protein [Pedobacter antarcticus]|uniref:hypothetical protein n=1 Tax=Pedobacter antarcticus TaxID=34086 RepID=UPI0029302DDE|nr:hypothetical protein [Pedobacter antarcticus]